MFSLAFPHVSFLCPQSSERHRPFHCRALRGSSSCLWRIAETNESNEQSSRQFAGPSWWLQSCQEIFHGNDPPLQGSTRHGCPGHWSWLLTIDPVIYPLLRGPCGPCSLSPTVKFHKSWINQINNQEMNRKISSQTKPKTAVLPQCNFHLLTYLAPIPPISNHYLWKYWNTVYLYESEAFMCNIITLNFYLLFIPSTVYEQWTNRCHSLIFFGIKNCTLGLTIITMIWPFAVAKWGENWTCLFSFFRTISVRSPEGVLPSITKRDHQHLVGYLGIPW